MRCILALCLALAFCLILPAALAEGSAPPPASLLQDVPGLEKPVTYAETKIPLGELVAKVAADTGVPLRAAPEVADEPVALAVSAFPARELLEELAGLLDYQWRVRRSGVSAFRRSALPTNRSDRSAPSDPSPERQDHRSAGYPPKGGPPERPNTVYEIWQDLASQQREAALRRSLYAAVEQRFQAVLESYRDAAKLSPDEIRRQWDDWVARSDQLDKLSPAQLQAWLNTAEAKDWDQRLNRLQNLAQPIQRSLAGLVTRLLPEQWTALRAGRQLVFSSAPRAGELPLPAEVLHTFQTSQPDVHPPGWEGTLPGDPDMAEAIRRKEKEMQERWAGADGYQVTVRFTPDYPGPGWIVFNAITSPIRKGQRVGPLYENPVFVVNVNPLDLQPPQGEDPARKALLAQDPLLGAKRVFPPPTVSPTASPPVPHSFRSLQDLLPDLARVYGVNFIADSYWTAPGINDRDLTAQPIALYDLLDRFTFLNHGKGRGYRWDRHGSLIEMRSRYWFLDRPREIPLRYVRRWIEQCDRWGSLTLAEDAAMASALTDPQLRSIGELLQTGVFPSSLQDLAGLCPARHLLRLYAALLPDQQQALQNGDHLPMAQLPARLRQLVLATLNEIARMRYPLLDLAQWEAGSLTFAREPQVRVREERGVASFHLEPAPVRTPAPPGEFRPAAVGFPGSRASIRRYAITRLKLQLFFGSRSPESVELIVSPTPWS